MLRWNVFMFLVKQGVLSKEDLQWLSHELENWEELGLRLKIEEATLTEIDRDYRRKLKKNLQNVTTLEREGWLSCNIYGPTWWTVSSIG